jgi:hypothetical protein
MVNVILTFVWVSIAMIAHSFWEAYVEGTGGWAKNANGWRFRIADRIELTAYHFYLFVIELPMLFLLPLAVYGWDLQVFGLLVSAFFFGTVLEDFFWFVVNPVFPFKDWNPRKVTWYPWLKIGKISIPWNYIIGLGIAVLSWYFIWKGAF